MFLLWSGIVAAHAACPDVDGLVAEARSAFEEAEVQASRQALSRAYDALGCQKSTVPRESLLALYHMDALASIADEDSKAALFAVIRAVSVDPDAPPPPSYGPELQAQHETWAGRLREDRVRVSVAQEGATVWIDGLALDGTEDVVTGEHVVQARTDEGWSSRVMDLSVGGKNRGMPIALTAVPTPEPVGPVGPTPPVGPPIPSRPRRVSGGVVAAGVIVGLAGGGGIVGGSLLEQRFSKDPYDAASYGDCSRSQPCYVEARADRIRSDARLANAAYLGGYGLVGVGVGLIGLELFVLRTDGGGSGLGVRGRL